MCPDCVRSAIRDAKRERDKMRCGLTTAVELERGLEGDALLGRRGLHVRSLGGIERVDVGLVGQ